MVTDRPVWQRSSVHCCEVITYSMYVCKLFLSIYINTKVVLLNKHKNILWEVGVGGKLLKSAFNKGLKKSQSNIKSKKF